MYQFLMHAHSGWRHLVLLIGIAAIANAAIGVARKATEWTKRDKIISLAYPIFIDVQALLGIMLWLIGDWKSGGLVSIRFEHPTIMLIGLVIAHVGLRRVKSGESCVCKHKHALAWFLVSYAVLILGIFRIIAAKAGG